MFSELELWEDHERRTPPEQMALDEALFLGVRVPVVRFYRWASPAVTFGYAQRYPEVCALAGALPLVRRWTGGGVVFHGSDLTMSLVVPEPQDLCREQASGIYRKIHEGLLRALLPDAPGARLANEQDCRPGAACFQSPALNDVLSGQRKICGGALRRGKKGLLYQGSLHGNFPPLAISIALSASVRRFQPGEEVMVSARHLAQEKYATQKWNQMR